MVIILHVNINVNLRRRVLLIYKILLYIMITGKIIVMIKPLYKINRTTPNDLFSASLCSIIIFLNITKILTTIKYEKNLFLLFYYG